MRALLLSLTLAASATTHALAAPEFTLNAEEAPDDAPWSDPASLAYTKNAGDKASIALDLAARADWRMGSAAETTNTMFVRGVAHRDNAEGSQVESYSAEVGAHFEPNTVPAGSTDPRDFDKAWYLFNDLSLAYAYTTNFDDEKDGCDATPTPTGCARSHESSLRLKWAVQPYRTAFESVQAYVDGRPTPESPAVAYAFGPVFTLFSDQVVDAKADAGAPKPKGNVTGAAASLGAAFAPKALNYRLVLRLSVQQVETLSRADARETSFPQHSTKGKASLDYELGLRSFEKGPGWTPSIGISYEKGDDPLAGKFDQERTKIAFKLSYKGE